MDYVIIAHGYGDKESTFYIPDNTYIYVYTPLGSELCLRTSFNDICANKGTYHRVYGPGELFPELYFTGDNERRWESGIKRCYNSVLMHKRDTAYHKMATILYDLIFRNFKF